MSYLKRQILPVLAQVLLYTGRFAEAQDFAQKSIDIHARVGESHEYVLYTLALACEHQRDYIPARSLIEQSLLEARRLNSWYHISFALDCSAEISMAEQRFEEASHQLQESLEILSNRKAPVMMGKPLANLAYTMRALGLTEKANYYLRKSLELAYRIGSFKQALHALPSLALSYGDRGNIHQAIQIFALAKKYPYVANSKWFEDIAGREIRSWEHTLVENRSGKSENIEQEIRIWDIVRQWLELQENIELII
jgi:tetratricopeptide (TPR) repeat protein